MKDLKGTCSLEVNLLSKNLHQPNDGFYIAFDDSFVGLVYFIS